MLVDIHDATVLSSVRVEDIEAYLESEGWHPARVVSDIMKLWRYTTAYGDVLESLVVSDATLPDYADYVSRLLRKLEKKEARSQELILRDITNISSDIMSVRVIRGDSVDGTLPVEDGFFAIKGSQDIVSSVARSVVEPKTCFFGQRPGLVSSYLKDVRLGQTQQGSYIITILSPLKMSPLIAEAEVFPRRVTKKILLALQALLNTRQVDITSETTQTSVETVIQNGISANLCEAVVDLFGTQVSVFDKAKTKGLTLPEQQVEISFMWSAKLPPPSAQPSVTFDIAKVSEIKAIAEFLREVPFDTNVRVLGYVTRLDRPPRDNNGIIKIEGTYKDKRHPFTVGLKKSDYDLAGQAHLGGKVVAITGNIVQRSKIYSIEEITKFEVL